MSRSNGVDNRQQQLNGRFRRHGTVHQLICQSRAFDVLHAKPRLSIQFAHFIHGNDGRMRQPSSSQRFGSQSSQILARCKRGVRNHLECYDAVQFFLVSSIHGPHTTSPHFFKQLIVTNRIRNTRLKQAWRMQVWRMQVRQVIDWRLSTCGCGNGGGVIRGETGCVSHCDIRRNHRCGVKFSQFRLQVGMFGNG